MSLKLISWFNILLLYVLLSYKSNQTSLKHTNKLGIGSAAILLIITSLLIPSIDEIKADIKDNRNNITDLKTKTAVTDERYRGIKEDTKDIVLKINEFDTELNKKFDKLNKRMLKFEKMLCNFEEIQCN